MTSGRFWRLVGACGAGLAGVLASFGCASDDPPSVRRYQLADTLVVESLKPLIRDTLYPVEVHRYGMTDGPPEYLFNEIYSFAVDDQGSVFVYDQRDGVRRYAVTGEYEGIVAGRGNGPEEVGSIVAMDASGAGRVGVIDQGNRRFAVFAPGRPSWSRPIGDGMPQSREGAIQFHDDGSLWAGANVVFPESGGIAHPRAVFLRVDGEAAAPDTVYTPASAAYHCPTLSTIQYARGFWEDNREPFVPKVKWALGPDGTFVVGCPASYHFYIHRTDGEVVRVARARAPVGVTQEERDFRERFPMPRAEATLPAYAKLIASGGGRIWVWPSQPGRKEPVHPDVAASFGVTHTWVMSWQGAFDVFTDEGDWLAVVQLPPGARYSGYPTEPNVVIRGDTIWAVEQDALDIQTVVRYEVPGLGR